MSPVNGRLAGFLTIGVLLIAGPAAAAETVANGIPQPTNIAFDPRGGMWVTSSGYATKPSDGVWYVRRPGARPQHVVRGLFTALGLTWVRGELLVSHVTPYATRAPRHVGRVTAFSRFSGGRFGRSRVVVDGLVTGLHRVDSLALGPRGRVYLGQGSVRDHDGPPGRVVSFSPRGGAVKTEATGLRNPYGLAFVPGTSTLFVSEHGRDDLGLRRPPEELNVLDVSRRVVDFGFPGGGGRGPLVELPAHAAPGAVAIGRWRRKLTLFVTEFGSSFSPPTGGRIVQVPLSAGGGRPRTFARLGRHEPLGLALGPDGALYVTLWPSGRVLRYR